MPSVIENPHREAPAATSHSLTNSAEAVKAQCLPMQLGAPQEIPLPMRPMFPANEAVAFNDASGCGQCQCKREVSGGLGKNVGRVSDQNATTRACNYVNIVVTPPDVRDYS